MDKIKVELTKKQIGNLDVFLQRVDLKGSEVKEFVAILNAIQLAVQTPEKITQEEEGE